MKDIQNNNEKRPKQLQEKHKKTIVFTALGLLFVGVMYLLFAPSTDAAKLAEGSKGMNVSIPQATNINLLDDKQSAYEQQQLVEAQERKRKAIANLSELFQKDSMPMKASKSYQNATEENPIGASLSAYRSINQTLGNFYTEDNTENKALQDEIEELKEQLEAKESTVSQEERQLELLEKSYQMASKYLPASAQGTMPISQGNAVQVSPIQTIQKQKRLVKSVQQHQELVVSSLQQRNWTTEQSFETAVGRKPTTQKNTIKACVHQTIALTQGESVPIRLLEAIQVANLVIPAQTVLMASPKLEGNRLLLTVSSIQHQEVLVPVELNTYDLDGQKGLYVPGTLEQNAVKEVLASLGNASGTAFSMNNSASDQLLTDMGRGVLQGTSNYLKKKIQHTKITLKAGHNVLLLSEIQ